MFLHFAFPIVKGQQSHLPICGLAVSRCCVIRAPHPNLPVAALARCQPLTAILRGSPIGNHPPAIPQIRFVDLEFFLAAGHQNLIGDCLNARIHCPTKLRVGHCYALRIHCVFASQFEGHRWLRTRRRHYAQCNHEENAVCPTRHDSLPTFT